MYHCLKGGDPSDPPVHQQKRVVRPVGEPKEEIVSPCVEEDQGDVGKAENAGANPDVFQQLLRRLFIPRVRRLGTVLDRGQDDVQRCEVENEESLPTRGNVAETKQRYFVMSPECCGIDDPRVEFGDEISWPRQKTEPREPDGDQDARQEYDKTFRALAAKVIMSAERKPYP